MNRRQFVAATGGALGLGAGIYGLAARRGRSTAERTPWPSDHQKGTDWATGDVTSTPLPEGETRRGAILSGISPASESASYFDALEAWLSAQQAIAVIFTDMEKSDGEIGWTIDRLERLWRRGYVPLLFLQPNFGAATGNAQAVTRTVAAGEHDDRLRTWATELAEWAIRPTNELDRRIYLNLAPELNGDWVPWGIPTPTTTPERYVRMWHRIHDAVMSTDLQSDHVQWIWTLNATSSEPLDVSAPYPGDDYADWVGITGYNWVKWGGWLSPERIYDGMRQRIREFTDQPLAVAEFGASADCDRGHCPDRKDAWIDEVYDYFAANDVRMACWFDHWVEKDGTDWGVFDTEFGTERFRYGGKTYKVYGNYRDAVRRDDVLPAHPVDARRLTTAEFDGSFGEK